MARITDHDKWVELFNAWRSGATFHADIRKVDCSPWDYLPNPIPGWEYAVPGTAPDHLQDFASMHTNLQGMLLADCTEYDHPAFVERQFHVMGVGSAPDTFVSTRSEAEELLFASEVGPMPPPPMPFSSRRGTEEARDDGFCAGVYDAILTAKTAVKRTAGLPESVKRQICDEIDALAWAHFKIDTGATS